MNNISKSQFSLYAAALAAAIAISGCSKSPEAEPAVQPSPEATAAADAAPPMAAPLTQDQVGAQYRISAEPVLVKNGEVVRTVVSVTNTGATAINSNGSLPVNLAVSLVDLNGAAVAQDFVRVSLPAVGIPSGGSAEVVAEVPANQVAGKALRFGLVQETVAWFSDFKIAPLDYGPFTSCEDQGKPTLCGKDGKPLAHVESN